MFMFAIWSVREYMAENERLCNELYLLRKGNDHD